MRMILASTLIVSLATSLAQAAPHRRGARHGSIHGRASRMADGSPAPSEPKPTPEPAPAGSPEPAPAGLPESPPESPAPTPEAPAPTPPTEGAAPAPAPTPAPGVDGIQSAIPPSDITGAPPPAGSAPVLVNGFVSTAFTHAFGAKSRGLVPLRAFDIYADSFSIDLAEITAALNPAGPGAAGFKLRLGFGQRVPQGTAQLTAADAQSGKDILGTIALPVLEAFASYVLPIGRGLRLDAGTFVTHHSLELIEGIGGFNDHYSKSFLFTYGPYNHTGLRASMALSDSVAVTAMVHNGWQANHLDINDSKGVGVQLALTPDKVASIYLNYMGSAEQPNNNRDWRHAFNLVAVLAPHEKVTLSLDSAYYTEALNGATQHWGVIGGWLKLNLHESFTLAVRSDYFRDRKGLSGFGTTYGLGIAGGEAYEITVTPSLRLGEHFVLRADLRLDQALGGFKPFSDAAGMATSSTQKTVGINFISYF